MKLTKKLKKQRNQMWADALKKNKGKEARCEFRNGKLRCCLCVAADVAAKELGKDFSNSVCGALPQKEVADYFGWNSVRVVLLGNLAMSWNDDEQLSHDQIAKLVEAEFCL